MKIVFNVSAMEAGGAERVVSLLSGELCERGHNVTIVMVSTSQPSSFYALNPGVALVPLLHGERKHSGFFNRIQLLKHLYEKIRPDVVIAFLPHICLYTYFTLYNTNIPYILSERNDPHRYGLLYRLALKVAFRSAWGCVFQTHDCLSWYKKSKNGPCDRVIFNPINPHLVSELNGVEPRKKNVLFVGRLVIQKNYILLLKAFQKFSLVHSDFVLDIYGDGPDKKHLFKLADNLGITNKIIYHGKKTNWHLIERNSSLFVLTSLYEGMPNSLAEAAAVGIPCVATDCPIGGSKELKRLFPNVLLVPNECSEEELCQKMEEALAMPFFEGSIPNSIRLSFVADEWEDLINDVCAKKE